MTDLPPVPLPPAALPDLSTARSLLTIALHQLQWARKNTLGLLEATPRELWFQPAILASGADGSTAATTVSHIAWQVGHLTVSQYGLLMFRMFGRQPDDLDLIPSRFRKAFSRGSDPAAVTADHYSADELWQRFNTVHQRSIEGLTGDWDFSELLQPIEPPYTAYPIKLGSILFCPLHEALHSGQIGLLRRALGLPPIH